MSKDLSRYIGKSYEDYDCLDLVKDFYLNEFGIQIKNYYEGTRPTAVQAQSLIVTNKGSFKKVEGQVVFGDIVVIKIYGIECHVGVVLDSSRFLHSARKIGSNIDRLERYSKMITGYFRHCELDK
jgi:hypothetical protein